MKNSNQIALPAISTPQTASELVALWRQALTLSKEFPQQREAVAHWAVSYGALSPLVNDNDIFEAIHAAFGFLESNVSSNDVAWNRLEKMVDDVKGWVLKGQIEV